ncbi:hypothetical protein EU527_16145 [Candidatus Thorarchaeota archaeon]|nr:MAG: hypothetical protein EU527_16145 [Candidatus Thorarchaeota archaeon]
MVILVEKHHARCAYCGATEGENWVTAGGEYGSGKLYCCLECRRAGEMWSSLCFSMISIPLIISLWSSYGHITPWSLFPLLFLIFCVVPVVMAIRGIMARGKISRKFSVESSW